ncbi:hypothetical protein [Chitinophaga filiformis]|uniref:Uncharacterized protein n=1 Tax=Chitinophaga filiformis TaxID=104663 RepID=A0A1G7X4Y9_CHIFI|nr:hypothetical protein [Chitinophaga filiformis]SDG79206.1 hypothetical protein SAMN04488121_106304 [Chitinophaga filiformis]
MEKISALIDKLQELKNSNAGLQSISYYVQLLQAEILHARNLQREHERTQQRQDSHVAVIMPATPLTTTATPATVIVEVPVTTSSRETLPENKQAAPVAAHTAAEASTLTLPLQNTSLPKPAAAPAATMNGNGTSAVTVSVPPSTAAAATNGATSYPSTATAPSSIPQQTEEVPADRKPAFVTIYSNVETPQPVSTPSGNSEKKPETNGARKELKELNQMIAQNTTSLNDRLKQTQTELGDRFNEIPVKDLRQAIGINDKFQFIQELFRGDVDTYERSVKTINEMSSLQEAEYWIERELKIRQGWVDDNRTVRQFYNLVKKRFS